MFNRVTGEPIWPIEERPVPKSDVPGEQAWPTQPFPTDPPPFATQTLTADDVNPYVLTPAERDAVADADRATRATAGCSRRRRSIDTVSIPGANGGANWGNTAAHPTNGTVYVLSINVPSIYRLSLEAPGRWRWSRTRRGGRRPRDRAGAGALRAALPELPRTRSARDGHAAIARRRHDALEPDDAARSHQRRAAGDAAVPRHLTQLEMDALVAFLGNAPAPDAAAAERRPPPPRSAARSSRQAAPQARVPRRARWRRHGRRAVSRRRRCAVGALLHRLRPEQHDREAAVLDADGLRPQHRHDQVADSAPATSRARPKARRDTGVISQRSGIIIDRRPGLLFHAGEDGKVRAHDADDRQGALDRHAAGRLARRSGDVRGRRPAVPRGQRVAGPDRRTSAERCRARADMWRSR